MVCYRRRLKIFENFFFFFVLSVSYWNSCSVIVLVSVVLKRTVGDSD